MAEYALPPGAIRRRAVFGLLDADGWTWASLKAAFWFLMVIFLLGYIPDRAYYFTVSPTIDLGYNAISPVNLCPAENDRGDRKLPCPAPAGAVVPWDSSPPELALLEGLSGAGTFASGSNLYLVGGVNGGTATADVLATTVTDGNLDPWTQGPALPAPRSAAAVITLSGIPYVIGGADASGAPTDTVFRGTVEEGKLTGWEAADELALPVALSDLAGVTTTSDLYIFGGRSADGLSDSVYRSALGDSGKLQAWTEMTELPLPEARARMSAVTAEGSIYIVGGEGPDGITNSVFYLGLDSHGDPLINAATERPYGWGVSVNESASAALPEPRADQASFSNGGSMYIIGGVDADGAPAATNYWTEPSPTNGTISDWRHLDATDLPEPRVHGSAAVVGPYVFVVGGTAADGSEMTSSLRAGLAPQLPFFRVGLFGLTVPALSIKGEIGQQLGYIIAGSAALGNFVILIVIGWMFSHRRETFRFFQKISRGRFRPPPEDDYAT